jgi:hypothetical protein
MTTATKEGKTLVEWVRADEEILTVLRPELPFNARASFQVFGERQFGVRFTGLACCCELPSEVPRRWEAALELREQ